MHLIRLDIDRKNSAAHLQVGPFGGGLNAIYAPLQGGSATMSRFVRSILFRGNYVNEVFETEEGESIDGSMQWVDASGHVRMMSFAGGSAMLPGGFVNSPLHPSQKPLHEEDADRIRGLGNIFWEGDQGDARWDELRGDILGMLFCSPLGSVSPEKLWWSASRLGVHSPARNELDEGYQRLKAEERDLLDRLRNADAVDHDRAWWTLERDRILAEIGHIQHANHLPTQPTTQTQQAIVAGLRERLASIQVELSTLQSTHQDLLVAEANAKLDSVHPSVPGELHSFQRGEVDHVQFRPNRSGRVGGSVDFSVELQRLRSRMDKLVAEKADVESQLRNNHFVPTPEMRVGRWDDAQLRQQLSHSEEMIRRWDRRAQWHRRLSEVQSHLKTRSPYRRTSEGSLIPTAEKYLRELTAGAARQLPPWAVESSYLRGHDMPVDFDGQPTEYGARELYYDRRLPSTDSRQRRLVDLAIRLAIAERAVPRIGRIPFLFDTSVEVFRGEALEQVLHVLAGFARDGRQILIATPDEFIARRIAAHGGAVSRMHEILRYARPRYVMDSYEDLGLHPNLGTHLNTNDLLAQSLGGANGFDVSLPARQSGVDYSDLNRQLSDWANEQEHTSWWSTGSLHNPVNTPGNIAVNGSYGPNASLNGSANGFNGPTGLNGTSHFDAFASPLRPAGYRPNISGVRPAPVGVRNSKYSLHLDSPIDQIPTIDSALVARLIQAGVHRVGDLLRSTPESLGAATRVDSDLMYYLQCIAELMTTIPMLKPFDARVLVGCGITRSRMLRDLAPSQLVDRVDSFLRSPAGSELVRTASPYEVSRIREWVASMGRSASGSASRSSRSDRSRRDDLSERRMRRSRSSSSLRAYEPSDRAVTRETRTTRTVREPRTGRESLETTIVEKDRSPRQRTESQVVREPRTVVTTRRTTTSAGSTTASSRLKFYLDVDSPVVDAPSIGPKMAAKLAAASIHTVSDLFAASPELLASKLADRFVSAELIFDWQRQALFVCRVPNLRGHDAQLIVGSGLHSAEELAAAEVEDLFEKVSQYASSKEGIKVLRGSPHPDREEVTNWIIWAANCRALRAA